MSSETYLDIHRRLGLPEIPQEMIDDASVALQREEQLRQDLDWVSEQRAYYDALLARLRRA